MMNSIPLHGAEHNAFKSDEDMYDDASMDDKDDVIINDEAGGE